jgi:hypothetical protein
LVGLAAFLKIFEKIYILLHSLPQNVESPLFVDLYQSIPNFEIVPKK